MLKHVLHGPKRHVTVSVIAPIARRRVVTRVQFIVRAFFLCARIATAQWLTTVGDRAWLIFEIGMYVAEV